MLATGRPDTYMDSFGYRKHRSNYSSIEPEDRTRQPGRAQPSLSSTHQQRQQHQQLPSFREIVPPALHSAIDSAGEGGAQDPSAIDPTSQANASINRTTGSGLPSPIFSQSSSMPDSLDELGHRNYDSLSYQQSRSNSTWSSSTNFTNDMATSYQRQPFYGQSFGPQKQFSGLPPIRDTPADGIYASGGAYPMYNGSPQASTPVDHPFGRRTSNYTGPLSSTYPGADRNYTSMDGSYKASYGHSYQQPRHSTSFYSESYGTGYNSMPGSMAYPPMNENPQIKRRRGNLPKHTTDLLRNWLAQHIDHPYPTEEEKTYLMSQTGLNLNQISNWFINARRRHWPAMKKEAQGGVKIEK